MSFDLYLGFAVKGHIDFPNWLAGKGNVSIYADQRGGGYDQKILSTDINIVANPTDPTGVTTYKWQATYPNDLPASSTPLSDPSPAPGSMVYSLTAVSPTFNGVLSDVAAFVDMGTYIINDLVGLLFIASSSRKSLTQVRAPGMAATARPGPRTERTSGRWSVSGQTAGTANGLPGRWAGAPGA